MENLLTTFVTDLDEVSNLSAEDLFLVSAPSDGSLNNSMSWRSGKVSYSTLSSKIAQDIQQNNGNLATPAESTSQIQERQSACESAVVKIANCLQQAKTEIQTINNALSGLSTWGDTGISLCGQTSLGNSIKVGNTVLTEQQLISLLNLI